MCIISFCVYISTLCLYVWMFKCRGQKTTSGAFHLRGSLPCSPETGSLIVLGWLAGKQTPSSVFLHRSNLCITSSVIMPAWLFWIGFMSFKMYFILKPCLGMCMCMWVCAWQQCLWRLGRESDALEWQLQAVVSYLWWFQWDVLPRSRRLNYGDS